MLDFKLQIAAVASLISTKKRSRAKDNQIQLKPRSLELYKTSELALNSSIKLSLNFAGKAEQNRHSRSGFIATLADRTLGSFNDNEKFAGFIILGGDNHSQKSLSLIANNRCLPTNSSAI